MRGKSKGAYGEMFVLEKVVYKDIIKLDYLEVESSVVTCLVGESGAGKTTLLRLLNRMKDVDSGKILYRNTPIEQFDPVAYRRKVTMLSQTALIFPGTIEHNLQVGLELTGRPACSLAELEEVLEIVQLQKALSEDAETLSGGEKQRVALARLLLLQPEVYLLDEPTAALDEETELKVMTRFLAKVKEAGGSVIMITHSKKLVEQCADRMIMLKKQ